MEFFTELDTHHGDKDMARKRVLELSNGKTIQVEAQDPYGLWHITYPQGRTPIKLSGAYTSYEDAKKALQTFYRQKSIEVSKEKLTIGDNKKDG